MNRVHLAVDRNVADAFAREQRGAYALRVYAYCAPSGEPPQGFAEVRPDAGALAVVLGLDRLVRVELCVSRPAVAAVHAARHHAYAENGLLAVHAALGEVDARTWAPLVPDVPGRLGVQLDVGEIVPARTFVYATRDSRGRWWVADLDGFYSGAMHLAVGPHPLPDSASEVVSAGRPGRWVALLPGDTLDGPVQVEQTETLIEPTELGAAEPASP